jgi:hypothetical protein
VSLFHRSRPVPAATGVLSDAGTTWSRHLGGYPYYVGVSADDSGQVTGQISLGTAEGGPEIIYSATDTEALTRLIYAADTLRRQMAKGLGRTLQRAR